MAGLIIQISEEEFQEKLEKAIEKALENFIPKKEEIKYLTRKEVAAKLRISLPTLNEYTKTGKLQGYRMMGRLLYKADEIDAALTSVQPLKYRRS
jgi:excisionase family DNA binding protein